MRAEILCPAHPSLPKLDLMLIATDIDGVLADFVPGWVGRYNSQFAAGLDVGALTAWDSIVTSTRFATAEEFFRWLGGIHGFWAELPPVDGASPAVTRLRAGGHRLIAVSQRPEAARRDTLAWLDRHFGGMPLVLTADKSSVSADILVDDSPEVLSGLVGTATVPVRFVRPWNEGAPGVPVSSWDDLAQVVALLDPVGGGRWGPDLSWSPWERPARPSSTKASPWRSSPRTAPPARLCCRGPTTAGR